MNVISIEEVLNANLLSFAESFSLTIDGVVDISTLDIAYQDGTSYTDGKFGSNAYTASPDKPYLEVWFINGRVEPGALGECAQNRHFGIYQIDIMSKVGLGDLLIKPIANGLEGIFYRGAVLTNSTTSVRVISSNLDKKSANSDWYMRSFTVEWRADLDNQ